MYNLENSLELTSFRCIFLNIELPFESVRATKKDQVIDLVFNFNFVS